MPIYEYHCKQCEKDFECLIFGNETPVCPKCESREVEKMLSACQFMSKGSGGETVKTAAGSSSCTGCSATSCSGCGT